MATDPTEPAKSWENLVATARKAPAPAIDVRHSVLAALPARRPQRPFSFTHELSARWGHGMFKLGFAACALAALATFHAGFRESEEVLVFFTLSF